MRRDKIGLFLDLVIRNAIVQEDTALSRKVQWRCSPRDNGFFVHRGRLPWPEIDVQRHFDMLRDNGNRPEEAAVTNIDNGNCNEHLAPTNEDFIIREWLSLRAFYLSDTHVLVPFRALQSVQSFLTNATPAPSP